MGRPLLKHRWDVDENGCWIWLGTRMPTGYGTIHAQGRRLRAHRASYEAFVGPIPDGLLVLHSCDVRACVAPHHLRVGTHSDNEADKLARGRHRTANQSTCQRGHDMSVENVLTWRGQRKCRECNNARRRARRAAARLAVSA